MFKPQQEPTPAHVLTRRSALIAAFWISSCVWCSVTVEASYADTKKSTVRKCELPCEQGTCVNGSCECFPGWQGKLCETCFGRQRLTSPSGYITEGSGNYSDNLRCSWLIDGSGTGASHIRLRLESLSTECGWDHVYIYAGDGIYGSREAAFSGSLPVTRSGNYRVDPTSEIIVPSSQAFIYFYSDTAFNSTGFNISYRLDACPLDCSQHGSCDPVTGKCSCEAGWTGGGCHEPLCAQACVHGKCDENGSCICQDHYRGKACNASIESPLWTIMDPPDLDSKDPLPAPRASHAAVVVGGDYMFVVGGAVRDDSGPANSVLRYNFESNKWSTVPSRDGPVPAHRYDHSLITWNSKLYMFGGIINASTAWDQRNDSTQITDELWSFDPLTRLWALQPVAPGQEFDDPPTHKPADPITLRPVRVQPGVSSPPMPVMGHTAHTVYDRMVVIFGYNPYKGFLNVVQEYYFRNSSWSIAKTQGALVVGTYGHSSVYDKGGTGLIYVFGGYTVLTQTQGTVTDRLLSYNPKNGRWIILASAGVVKFRHSAVLLPGTLVVFGGNSHNESHHSKVAECCSSATMVYEIACNSWYPLESHPTNQQQQLPYSIRRYGHTAVTHNDVMFVFGGFNGRMLNDVIKLDPGQCGVWRDREGCEGARYGVKCAWRELRCIPVSQAESLTIRKSTSTKRGDEGFERVACPAQDAGQREAGDSLDYEESSMSCDAYKNCPSCHNNFLGLIDGKGCQWCEDSCQEDCADLDSSSSQRPKNCSPVSYVDCGYHQTCLACQHEPECRWIPKATALPYYGRCQKGDQNVLADAFAEMFSTQSPDIGPCAPACAALADCGACTDNGCMWCSNLRRCVDINAHSPVLGLYGQCLHWATKQLPGCAGPLNCSAQLTCEDCQNIGPACGWCDDGSGTGLGKCIPGSLSGPANSHQAPWAEGEDGEMDTCPADQWYFFSCPACQCNGHGRCQNGTSSNNELIPATKQGGGKQRCLYCDDMTTGDHCQYCKSGFWGNALNGGNCSVCSCNGQARDCDPSTGKCYCFTKGVIGHHCDRCDEHAHYVGDPRNDTCYYRLNVDFIFTFQLNPEEDGNVTNLNFLTRPQKSDADVTFKLECSSKARVNLTLVSDAWVKRKWFLANNPCQRIERRFNKDEYRIGAEFNTTFFVFLYDIKVPMILQISFAQNSDIDWIRFFITFASCFLTLLVIAIISWKLKLHFDVYRRRQRMFVEMEQMASRPFGSVQLDLSEKVPLQKQCASPLSIEPCSNYRAAVVTVAVRLPTGGHKFTPSGQTGLAIASALANLTPSQRAQLQSPPPSTGSQPEPKRKKHRPSCIS